jgi:hypothetical protein
LFYTLILIILIVIALIAYLSYRVGKTAGAMFIIEDTLRKFQTDKEEVELLEPGEVETEFIRLEGKKEILLHQINTCRYFRLIKDVSNYRDWIEKGQKHV